MIMIMNYSRSHSRGSWGAKSLSVCHIICIFSIVEYYPAFITAAAWQMENCTLKKQNDIYFCTAALFFNLILLTMLSDVPVYKTKVELVIFFFLEGFSWPSSGNTLVRDNVSIVLSS